MFVDRNATGHLYVVVTYVQSITQHDPLHQLLLIWWVLQLLVIACVVSLSPLTSSAWISPFTTHDAPLCDKIKYDINAGLLPFKVLYSSPPSTCKCKHEEADDSYHNVSHSSAPPVLYPKYQNECGRYHHGNKHAQASQQEENFPTKLSYIVK